jgi:drug/metabolite transporter (DMT)-like permease
MAEEAEEERRPGPWMLAGATAGLFLVWSNTFLAFEVLLGRMAWVDLLVARMVPVGLLAALWCVLVRRREATEALRRHPGRVVAAALLSVPGYGVALYFGMANHVAGPIASLLTTLSPLYLLLLGVTLLGERVTARKTLGLGLGLAGVVLIASARGEGGGGYALHVAIVAMAPLCWSLYSALSKPVLGDVPPLVWTYVVLAVGAVPLLPVLALRWEHLAPALSGEVVLLLAYLVLAATIGGNAVWSWLLRHLPASTVGLTIFLNPPLTTASKALLAALFPASFAFAITGREWVGGALALAGVAVAVLRPRGAGRNP